jgi:hypothetical protein
VKNYRSPWLAASILAFSFAGCAGLNDAHYEKTQKLRAVREYISCGNPQCEKFPHDYKLGWIDGFYNISTGGPSCPPAVAPERYWNPSQVLKDCDNRRHSYYSGWQDGASRASQFPDTHHLKIFETCECPMPRCETACGTGDCVPCGLGSVGSPVHAELIEMPYVQESILPTPVVPPAPVSSDDSDDDDEMIDGDDDTTNVDAADRSQNVTMHRLEMLETEPIKSQDTAEGGDALGQESRAASIYGSAFDVIRDDSSTVKLQEQDPIETVKAVQDQSTESKAPQSEANHVATTEPKIIVPAATIRKVEESSGSTPDGDIPSEGTVKLVKKFSFSPAGTKNSDGKNNAGSTKAKAAKKPAAELKQVSMKKPARLEKTQGQPDQSTKQTRHPAVAKETIPVRFEMIESYGSDKPQTVVQAK